MCWCDVAEGGSRYRRGAVEYEIWWLEDMDQENSVFALLMRRDIESRYAGNASFSLRWRSCAVGEWVSKMRTWLEGNWLGLCSRQRPLGPQACDGNLVGLCVPGDVELVENGNWKLSRCRKLNADMLMFF